MWLDSHNQTVHFISQGRRFMTKLNRNVWHSRNNPLKRKGSVIVCFLNNEFKPSLKEIETAYCSESSDNYRAIQLGDNIAEKQHDGDNFKNTDWLESINSSDFLPENKEVPPPTAIWFNSFE